MNIKSFTLGLGFGIIILSIIFYVVNYFDDKRLIESYPKQAEVVELTDDDIMDRAKKMGMYTQDELDTAISNIKPSIGTVFVEEELTDDQIIEKAYSLGMVFNDVLNVNEEMLDSQVSLDNQVSLDSQASEVQVTDEYSQFVSVRINGGLSANAIARLLQEKDVVDNADTFQNFLINKGVTTILNAGTFVFPLDANYEDVLDVLRRRKQF